MGPLAARSVCEPRPLGVGCNWKAGKRPGRFPSSPASPLKSWPVCTKPIVCFQLHRYGHQRRVFQTRTAGRSPRPRRLEDAYAELVNSRPLSQTAYPLRRASRTARFIGNSRPIRPNPRRSPTAGCASSIRSNGRPFRSDSISVRSGRCVGKLLGMLDGTHQAEEIKTVVMAAPREAQPLLTQAD